MPDQDTSDSNVEDNVLKGLIHKRGQLKAQLTRFGTFLNSLTDGKGITELKKRTEKLDGIFSRFEELQSSIEERDASERQEEERESFESLFYQLSAQGDDYIQKHSNHTSSPPSISSQNSPSLSQNQPQVNVKLPSIDLPSFNGRYEDWTSFSDTFNALIHENDGLTDIQKYHYLRSALKGDASQVIQSLEITSSNYQVAWDLLENRFRNSKIIVQNHIRSLFNLPSVERDSSLRQLLDGALRHVRALKALKQPTDSWDTLLVHILSSKLTSSLQREWELASKPDELPSFEELCEFLQRRCQIQENYGNGRQLIQRQHVNTFGKKPIPKTCALAQDGTITCRVCKGKHLTHMCKELLTLSQSEKYEKLKTAGVCYNCLKPGHRTNHCQSGGCRICKKKHNTCLHPSPQETIKKENPTQSDSKPSSTSNSVSEIAATSTSASAVTPTSQVLLSTAVVEVVGPTGIHMKCRALLDNGSQSCFMTENVVQHLGLAKSKTPFEVAGVGSTKVNVKGGTSAVVRSRVSNYRTRLNFIVVKNITGDLPRERVNLMKLNIPKHVALADPTFNMPGKIDILLGQEVFLEILCIGQIKGVGVPTLQKTKLGWVAGGRFVVDSIPSNEHQTCMLTTTDLISRQLQQFWALEDFSEKTHLTKEERTCEDIYRDSTTREEDGRYTVTMPLKMDPHELGESKRAAERRLLQVERRMVRDPDLHQQYVDFMSEYEQLGHMEKVENNAADEPEYEYYLPHHAVMKASSTTTKLRVVFDASAKTSSDLSLNNIQMVGPNVQSDIISIFLRFRTHDIVLTADVEKMYRQVNITSGQQNLLKILWRESPELPISTYKLKTVTYGTASASFLATRTLMQLADDEKHQLPRAAEVLRRDFYVDDLLTGVQTEEEATTLQHELTTLLKMGGFNLRKWSSNSRTLRETFSCGGDEKNKELPPTHENMAVKTLGLWWDSDIDEFKFLPQQEPSATDKKRVTKRTMLSEIARLFDPLGLVGPVVVRAKMQLQELWKLNLGWDESLPMSITTEWLKLSNCLNDLKHVTIPRQATLSNCKRPIELCGFADASEKAYGCAIYLRHEDEAGNVKTSLLCAKSRVAPLKTVSLPRLELCAALLLSELMDKVSKSLDVTKDRATYWTDSTVVLAWLQSEPSRWTTFVANRVSKIQDLTEHGSWKHVKTEENPADIISRGSQAYALIDSNLWWNGPTWLSRSKDAWPADTRHEHNVEAPEARQRVTLLTNINEEPSFIASLTSKFSKFSTLNKVIAYCLRFLKNAKSSERTSGVLTPIELQEAKMKIIQLVQTEVFKDDIKCMKKGEPLRSHIQSLAPFVDPLGTIRVGGRLDCSDLPSEVKHPILLPKCHALTEMIFRHEHIRNLHCGPQALLYAVRQEYWPISGRSTARKITHECIRCFRAKPKIAQQQMGDLPAARVNQTRSFSYTGVDYCGPLYIKQSRRRGAKIIKTYVCVFVCMATKAVHLELVSDLSTDTFLAALRRFISRRGICVEIRSDNGKNFRGASRELKELRGFFDSEATSIVKAAASHGIRWTFNPPYSPHMGGIWEAAVKSLKQHLKRTIGNASLTFEELNTVLTQVEAVLNSRPISPMSSDPSDLSVLTPSHFLTHGPLTAVPEPSLMHLPEGRLSRWQRVQQLLQHFWSRWSREYLTHLQSRGKWKQPRPSIEPGTLVLLKDDKLPPLAWPLGRVTQLHPGRDNRVRVVSVRTSSGVVSRAINKLCPLPLESDSL